MYCVLCTVYCVLCSTVYCVLYCVVLCARGSFYTWGAGYPSVESEAGCLVAAISATAGGNGFIQSSSMTRVQYNPFQEHHWRYSYTGRSKIRPVQVILGGKPWSWGCSYYWMVIMGPGLCQTISENVKTMFLKCVKIVWSVSMANFSCFWENRT